jgi:hypothetical protein
MAMEDIIERLRERNQNVLIPLELPDEDQLVLLEEEILIGLPDEYKGFLLEVSDVICGSIEPATAADPNSHTYIAELAANAWNDGLAREFIPVCHHQDTYYCIDEDGEIFEWGDGEFTDQTWSGIWMWAKEVWLES